MRSFVGGQIGFLPRRLGITACYNVRIGFQSLRLLLVLVLVMGLVMWWILQEMIEEADRDQDGVVNADEFYRVMRKREDPLDDLDSDDEY